MTLPEEPEGREREDASEGEDEGEGFSEISKAEGEAHESGVVQMSCREMPEKGREGEEEKCLKESVGADFAHTEFVLGRDDKKGDAEIAESVTVEKKRWRVGWCGNSFAELAETDESVGEGDNGEHLEEEDAEVDHIAGMEFGVAGGVEESVADGESGRVERIPVAVDDGVPVVSADKIADVHVGDGVAVYLV